MPNPAWWKLPEYNGNSLVNLGGSILKSFDIKTELSTLKQSFGKHSRIILFLLDCLGQHSWKKQLENQPKLRQQMSKHLSERVITTVAPSTTNTVITSLVTGTTPAEHGWIGYHVYVKEAGGVLNGLRLSHVTGSEAVTSVGVDHEHLITATPWFQALQENGVPSFYVHKTDLMETPLSHLLYRGCHGIGYDDVTEMMLVIERLLESTEEKKVFVYAYWDMLDTYAHQEGPSSKLYADSFHDFFTVFSRKVLPNLRKGDLVLMTGDHGCLDMEDEHTIWVNKHEGLFNKLILPPFCEPRLTFLRVKPGERTNVKNYLLTHFKGKFAVNDVSNELITKLFGKHKNPVLSDRIGDLIVTSKKHALKYSYTGSLKGMSGMHGGLTKDEMEVPLLIWQK